MSKLKEISINEAKAILAALGWQNVEINVSPETFEIKADRNGGQELKLSGLNPRHTIFCQLPNQYGGKDMLRVECDTGKFYIGSNSCAFYSDCGANITSSFINPYK